MGIEVRCGSNSAVWYYAGLFREASKSGHMATGGLSGGHSQQRRGGTPSRRRLPKMYYYMSLEIFICLIIGIHLQSKSLLGSKRHHFHFSGRLRGTCI